MQQDRIIVTVPPQQLRLLRGRPAVPAHLAYQIGPGPRLLRAPLPARLRGGLMVVEQGAPAPGPARPFCQEVLRECTARGYSGVLLDADRRTRPTEQLALSLRESLDRRKLSLFVPEWLGPALPGSTVMIPSALSGGSLSRRLEEAAEHFGAGRTALALERSAEDFTLPAPTGCGRALSPEELRALMDRLEPCIFFSDQLCARYFTYMAREGGAHFVLFDDGDTLNRKMETARRAGIRTFLLPWTELDSILPIDGGSSRR